MKSSPLFRRGWPTAIRFFIVAGFASFALFGGQLMADDAVSPATISLDDLLAKVRAAAGTWSRSGYRIVERYTIDGDVSVDETFGDNRGYKTTETSAGGNSAWGRYRNQSWYQNSNGFVQLVSGAYSAHDPIANAVRAIGTKSGDATLLGVVAAPAMYVVQVKPSDGLSETRYYDASTYLLKKIETEDYDGHTRISEYGDYRRVFGRMVPFLRVDAADFYRGTRRYEVVSYDAARPTQEQLAMPASHALFDLQGRGSVTIPADFTDDGIIVRVNTGGRGLDLVLDSGSSSIVVNASVASELGLTVHNRRQESWGGVFSMGDTHLSDVSIGPLRTSSMAINVAPIDDNVAPTQRAVGLLGCDFIASGALEVNFAAKTLTLYEKTPPNLEANGWTELPASVDDCVPLIKANFSGLDGQFIIDTGAYSTVLYPHYFSQFGSRVTATGDPAVSSGEFIGGDEVRFYTYTMRTLSIGNLSFADALVQVPTTKKVQDRTYDGLLGRPTISNFNILFDYPNQRVYLKPNM